MKLSQFRTLALASGGLLSSVAERRLFFTTDSLVLDTEALSLAVDDDITTLTVENHLCLVIDNGLALVLEG